MTGVEDTSNTGSYSMSSRGKQRFKSFRHYKHTTKICRVPIPAETIVPCSDQGIIDYKRTETQQIFSRMFVMAKTLKSYLPLL